MLITPGIKITGGLNISKDASSGIITNGLILNLDAGSDAEITQLHTYYQSRFTNLY
jgi:hypothetical protein